MNISNLLSSRIEKLNDKGSIALFTVFGLAIVFGIIINVQSSLMSSRSKFFYQEYNKFALETVVKSSFGPMEAALKRRLWEMPPDDNCSRTVSTNLNISTDGIAITVTARFDTGNSILTLTSIGRKQNLQVKYVKMLKIFDASDFLLYSLGGAAANNITLGRSQSHRSVAALIAGPRKIYVNNPIVFYSNYIKPPNSSWWANGVSRPSYSPNHHYLGTVLQSERMVLAGGIRYGVNAGNPLSDYTESIVIPLRAYGYDLYPKPTDFGAVITDDYNSAIQAIESVRSDGAISYPSTTEFLRQVYPSSLFCGTPPLVANNGVDSGCFNNSTSARYSNRLDSHAHGVVREFDLYCLSEKTPDGRSCSDSLQFPRGFNNWKNSAGLGNVLFTEDKVEMQLNPLTWDNLQALKQDAQQCGHYISRERNAYTDCDAGDAAFLRRYATSGGTTACDRYSRVNLDSISLPNLNVNNYRNGLQNQWFRRVIYSDVPIEIAQNSPNGLWNTIVDAQARQNMPIWIVTPEAIRLKPHQFDLSSPLTTDPGRKREIFFNAPSNPTVTRNSLKLIFVTPEVLNIVSPQRVNVSLAAFQQMYPVVGGRIRPVRSIHTDYVHQENDGYLFGARIINLKNMVLISNPNQSTEISLTGLWNGYNRVAVLDKMEALCMYANINANPPFSLTNNYNALDIPRPSYATGGNSVLPGPSSRFYSASDRMTTSADVFRQQYNGSDANDSVTEVNFSGLRLLVGFEDAMTPLGRNLSRPTKSRSKTTTIRQGSSGLLDLSQRRYTWLDNRAIFGVATNQSCNSVLLSDGSIDESFGILVNAGDFSFLQERVDLEFSNSGNFSAKNVLLIRARKTIQ